VQPLRLKLKPSSHRKLLPGGEGVNVAPVAAAQDDEAPVSRVVIG